VLITGLEMWITRPVLRGAAYPVLHFLFAPRENADMGINLDLSKALHPRILDVLTAFMPGLFFEICVLVGNPTLVLSLARPPLDRPTSIAIAIVMAFIIGNFFMLWVRFFQLTFSFLLGAWYRFFPPLWKKFLMYLLRARGNPPQQSWFASFRFLQHAYGRAWDDAPFQDVAHAWQRIAGRLLKYYKIDPPAPGTADTWMPWTEALGALEPEDLRGYIMMVASHATGWSGLAAIHFAPALHSRYFLGFCLFSILTGLLHDWRVAYRLCSPEHSWALGVRRTFEELKRTLDKRPDAQDEEEPGTK
jgi:hypothetical protein